MIAQLAGLLAIACYFLACALLGRALMTQQAPSKMLILSLGAIALPLHGFSIIEHIYQHNGIHLGLLILYRLLVG